ncbi:MAG TPA: GNAT family N-acetyltransferase [Actinocrinis sp.]|nr:GNAT family N-acetyltransferase [Actinocrinis sp.]
MLRTRPATAHDLETLVALETGPDTARYLGTTGLGFHRRALADPDQEHIVGELGPPDSGAAIVGFVLLAGLRDGGGLIELRRIVLSGAHRGGGHGRALFRAAVARAYRWHCATGLWLDVKPDNARGRALYESEGLARTGTIPDPTDPGGRLLLMAYPARPAFADEPQTIH